MEISKREQQLRIRIHILNSYYVDNYKTNGQDRNRLKFRNKLTSALFLMQNQFKHPVVTRRSASSFEMHVISTKRSLHLSHTVAPAFGSDRSPRC